MSCFLGFLFHLTSGLTSYFIFSCQFFCRDKINELRVKVRDSRLEGPRDIVELSKRRIDQSAAAMKESAALISEDRNLKLVADRTWEKLDKTRKTFVVLYPFSCGT